MYLVEIQINPTLITALFSAFRLLFKQGLFSTAQHNVKQLPRAEISGAKNVLRQDRLAKMPRSDTFQPVKCRAV